MQGVLRLPVLLLAALLLVSAASLDAGADSPPAGEYQVKAAFILNFANFVEWPVEPASNGALTIGVLGHDSFDGALDALKGKSARRGRVVVRHYDEPDEAAAADVLFISASEARMLPRVLKILRGRPVLTIGDSRGFAQAGVMINMVVHRKRVGFEINVRESRRSGLRISSQLLRLAREVVEQ